MNCCPEPLIESTPSGLNIEEMFGYTTANNNFPGVMALVFKHKTSVAGFTITKQASLMALAWPNLVAILGVTGAFWVQTNPLLNSVSAPLLASTPFNINISNNVGLGSIILPSLVTAGTGLDFTNNFFLVTVSLPVYLPTNTKNQNMSGCALNQLSVDHVLARCVANPAYVNGTVNLSGGTSAAPSVAGQVDKATLIARGVSVATN